jgi:hypothetical protein
MIVLLGVWDLPTLVNVVTAAAVALGVPFALLQLHHAYRARRDLAAVDIVRTVQTQEVRRAVERVLRLPNDADPALIRNDLSLLDAALAVDSACEMWGCMVFEGVVDHHLLDRMVGGWVRGTWRRLNKWVESERAEKGNVNIAEWWQWLYELLERDPDSGKAKGAHLAYRGINRRH